MTSKTQSRPNHGKAGAKPEAARLSRMLAVETVPDTGLDIKVCASDDECAALARDCGLVAVQAFEASFHVRKQDRGRVKVLGVLEALVTQTCVVSLEPFEALVRANVDVDFAPAGPAADFAPQEEPPDPVIGGQIDLGALAEEFLVLNLDLYPRKPGAVFEEASAGGELGENDSPFAVLRRRP